MPAELLARCGYRCDLCLACRENIEKDDMRQQIPSRQVVQQTCRDAPSRIEAVRNRNTSVLTMIPEESFQEGLRNLEDYVRRHPDDDWLLFDRMTMTIGRDSPGGDP